MSNLIDPVTGLPLSHYGYCRKEEIVNSAITYYGVSAKGSDTNALTWQILRKYTSGSTVTYSYANNDPGYRFSWAARASYFEVEPLTNLYSVSFNGINESITFGNNFNYDIATAFSISLWVKPNNLSAIRMLFSKLTADANVYGYGIYHTTTGEILLQMRSPSGLRTHTFFGEALAGGVWANVVLTYAGNSNINGARCYVNGILLDVPAAGTLGGSWLLGQPAMLGARTNASYFSGNLDQLSVWNKALDASEVAAIYNSGQPGVLTEHVASGSLVSWYKLGDGDVLPSITDQKGMVTGTAVNMDSTNIVQDIP